MMTYYTQKLDASVGPFSSRLAELNLEKISCFAPLYGQEDIEYARSCLSSFHPSHIIVLGTGGSNLGAKALADCIQLPIPLLFMDNIDPYSFSSLFNTLQDAHPLFIAISKSGTTMETLQQVRVSAAFLQEKGRALAQHMCVLTEDKPSPLQQFAKKHELVRFDHPKDIGGRFSVFSLVGILPLLFSSFDYKAFRSAALTTVKELNASTSNAAWQAACLHWSLMKRGYSQHILMPYNDSLDTFTQWHRQLWAESLGKEGKGTTPVKALGTVDQHSQLQLYLDGPQDKFFSFIMPRVFTGALPQFLPAMDDLDHICLPDLLYAEAKATYDTLRSRGYPCRFFTLQGKAEEFCASLMTHFVIETLYTAQLLDIDPFTQPAVEAGKKLTRIYLSQ